MTRSCAQSQLTNDPSKERHLMTAAGYFWTLYVAALSIAACRFLL